MKKYIATILLLLPVLVFAHEGGVVTNIVSADLSFLNETTEQLKNTSSQNFEQTTEDKAKLQPLINKLKQRNEAMVELSKQNPALALRYIVQPSTRLKQHFSAQRYIEKFETISGILRVMHIDDFYHPENSYFLYSVINGGKEINIRSAKDVESISGVKVSLSGYRLNEAEILTDGKNIQTSQPALENDALGKQRALVLLVNSVGQPEQPITKEQAEEEINVGQFQKFIKEASYNQTWFDAKVYGWIKIPNPETHNVCGFVSITDNNVRDFLNANNISLSNFDRVVFLVPGLGGCSEVGKMQEGYSVSWVGVTNHDQPSAWGVQPFLWSNLDSTLSHEIGHAFGLRHANGFDCGNIAISGSCRHVEYGNTYDTMGGLNLVSLHYNGLYKEILGWIKSEDILSISKNGTYTTNFLEATTSSKKFVKIYNPALFGTDPQYTLESRNAVGFDRGINAANMFGNSSGLLVNRVVNSDRPKTTRLIDTKPSSKNWNQDLLDAGLRKGETFIDPGSGITVGPIVSQTSSTTVFNLSIAPPTCIRSAPSADSYIYDYNTAQSGLGYIYLQVSNNDSLTCPPSRFELSVPMPDNSWTVDSRESTKLVPAQSTDYLVILFNIPENAIAQGYWMNTSVRNLDQPNISSYSQSIKIMVWEKPGLRAVSPAVAKPGDRIFLTGEYLVGEKGSDEDIILYNSSGTVYKHILPDSRLETNIQFILPEVPDGKYTVRVYKYGAKDEIELTVGVPPPPPPPPVATSTISNVSILNNPNPVYKYESYQITWQGTNLRTVNIDLYDLKGLYKQKTIEENHSVAFSKDNQTFTYNWYVSGNSLPDDIYKIKITDALNKKVKGLSDKITIQNYQIPTIGTAQAAGIPTAKLIFAPGGRESSVTGTFNIKINAIADVVNIPVGYGFYIYAKRLAPEDKPNEYSTMYNPASIDSATGDFSKVEDSKYGTMYRISKGKSATLKISASFKPEQMFAGEYSFVVYDINILNNQNKRANLTFTPAQTSNSVTLIGEKSPYVLSVNNPINADASAVIEGERFSDVSNIMILRDKNYTLPGAKDGKITFIPEKVGLPVGVNAFQIDSPAGKSNSEYIDIRPASTNGANVFTAFWNLLKSMF